MSGTMMAIEVLGRLLVEKDNKIKEQQETVNKLNKKIDMLTQYIEVYEECLKSEESK